MRISDWSSDVCSSDLDLQPFGIGYFGDRKREIFHTKEGERQIVAVVTTAAGKTLHFGAAIAKSTGDPECVAEMRGHLAEPGDLLLIGLAVEPLIIFVGQPGQPLFVEQFLRNRTSVV